MEAKNNKKTIWAWSMFDWANQSYNMVITSTIFPAYYVYYTTFHNPNHDIVTFFGHKYVNTVFKINMLGLSYPDNCSNAADFNINMPITGENKKRVPAVFYVDGRFGLRRFILV